LLDADVALDAAGVALDATASLEDMAMAMEPTYGRMEEAIKGL
jgi:hypothetical protein